MEVSVKPYSDIRERHAAMELVLHDRVIGTEFFNFVCGDLLGYGCHRYVFEYNFDKRFVVKCDLSSVSANNIEWQIWDEVQHYPKLKRWFAPVGTMTKCGRIMLQRKAKTNIELQNYPTRVPDFFEDLKHNNWGMINGKVVCFDYASTRSLNLRNDYKLVKAQWIG